MRTARRQEAPAARLRSAPSMLLQGPPLARLMPAGFRPHVFARVLVASGVLAGPSLAQAPAHPASGPVALPERPLSHAARARETIHLDGRLDEPAWADAS